ncbi:MULTISPECIES: CIA30 family protein [unclassified Colwellia]|uniref:CIA30 family protein n=1 Tax=unclassified Colwellia TaxID=196834 RepID=UPI002174D644|nr:MULTISPECIES: CIA30 family protein [unclassified Colwellia]
MRVTVYALLLSTVFAGYSLASTEFQIQAKQNKQLAGMAKKESALMINFTEQQSLDSWRITNDGVMGGKSQGQISLQVNKAIFSGDISLANNGGFSSVFRPIEPLAKALESVTIDIEGDGLTYQLRLIVNLDGYRMAYKQSFDTVAGQQTQLSFILADFQASFRGREIPNAPVLTSENIREVGFLVTSKVAGPFSLIIASVFFK